MHMLSWLFMKSLLSVVDYDLSLFQVKMKLFYFPIMCMAKHLTYKISVSEINKMTLILQNALSGALSQKLMEKKKRKQGKYKKKTYQMKTSWIHVVL